MPDGGGGYLFFREEQQYMCGIVGYVGAQQAAPILLDGLRRLEYRGYDSAGMAVCGPEGLRVCKAKGRLQVLAELTEEGRAMPGTLGVGHTRWATHGEPNDVNAHPQVSRSGLFAVVHNGIIENYAVLRERLERKGYVFRSQTDTEVVAQLLEDCYVASRDLFEAVNDMLSVVEGAYALGIVCRDAPDRLIAVRKDAPLLLGYGEGCNFIASDVTAIIKHTRDISYMDDGEVAVVTADEIQVFDALGQPVEKQHSYVDWDVSAAEKGGYPHFMLKEIYEQSRTIVDCIRGRINPDTCEVKLSGVIDHRDRFVNARRIIFVACGTSWHASLIGEHLVESICRIPVEVEYASEFRYRNPIIREDDIVVAVSQSGETADTLAAVELARKAGAFVFGICNVVGSSIARATDSGAYIHVGPEIGVASTKAFTGQVTVMAMLALAVGRERGTVTEAYYNEVSAALLHLPETMEEVLKVAPQVADLAKIFTYAHNFIYLGRGYNYPTALEGALKLKEISYIHAEGYPAAEMKHGPIALIDAEMPTVAIATPDHTYEKTASNIEEIKARGGKIIAVIARGDEQVRRSADFVIEVPVIAECLMPIVVSVPLQLLAYYIAVYKGRNVDQPRNLAKSVTVE